ncbi:MAG TPA: hypothetical protein VHT03_03995 [Rhizomicrobium sp.]|nr:hypothetical protein [Rhizomicrobium sp.]
MRLVWLAATFCAVAQTASGATLPPPISSASEGKLQCYAPNLSTKSCQSLAAYRFAPDGSIINPATVLISAVPVVTMRTTTSVKIKANGVCGFIRQADVDTATFTIGDTPANAAQTAMLRQQMGAAQKNFFDHEICTNYTPQGDGLVGKVYVDGVPQPQMDQKVMWVYPTDGFKVRP